MRRVRNWVVGTVTICAGLGATSHALSQQEKAEAAPPILAMNTAGMDAWLSSDKDRGLRNLLHMIEPRLAELPAELERLGFDDAGDIPPGFLEAVWGIATQPQAFELRLNLGRLRNQEAPVDVRWAAAATDLRSASSAIGLFRGMLQHSPVPILNGDEPGVFVADTPALPVYFGAKRIADSNLMFVSTEAGAFPSMHAQYTALPQGAKPLMGLRFDLAQLTPVVGMGVGMAPPVVGELLMEGGLIGWDASSLNLAVGHDDKHMISVARVTGAARASRLLIGDPEHTLDTAALRLIPEDATVASAGVYDPSTTFALARRVMESMEVWEEVERELRENAQIELSTIESFIGSLGDSWVFYQSDSTGGGEFASGVLSVSLRDRAAFEQSLATAIEKANALGMRQGKGYFRIRASEIRGIPMYTITAPGLPIPVEPAIAISNDRLFVTVSVPTMLAAIDQQKNGKTSIMSRDGVKAMAGGSFEGLAGFSFMDTERYARRGYAMMNHLMAGLANGVRSPSADRDPYAQGVAMPSFSEFVKGISPTVTVSRWDGEDLVVNSKSDRSMSVVLASGLGRANLGAMAGQFLPMMMAGGMSGYQEAAVVARSSANQTQSMSQVRSVVMGAIVYASDTGDGLPASIDVLIEEEYLMPSALRSPFGSMMDGTPDIVIRTDLKGKETDFAAQTVLAIDRSALAFNGAAPVGFMDGHVEWLDQWEIEQLLEREENRGAREAFGL